MNARTESAEELREELAAVRRDIEALAGTVGKMAATETAGAVAELRKQVDGLMARGNAAAQAAGAKAGEATARLEATVERNPLTAVAIALAAGYLMAILSRRK
ncbi:MAG: hypothetical protein AB7K86_05415 [Rhodospirillales bacterium]